MADYEDVYQALLGERIVFLRTAINEHSANNVIAQLLCLEKDKPGELIKLYINSSGGEVPQGLAIYDTMQALKSPVSTLCMGQAMSLAAVLLCAGTPGERYALTNSRVLIHQPQQYGVSGTESSMKIHVQELKRNRDVLEQLIAKHSGQTIERVHQDCEKDLYMSAEEAKNYGLIDDIITQDLLERKPYGKS